MTTKSIMDVHLGRPFHINFGNFGMAHAHLPKHQKVVELASDLEEITLIKYERSLDPSGAHANNSDSSVHAVH